jgi:putative transposase
MSRPPTLFVPPLRKHHRVRIQKALARSRHGKYRDKCRAVLWSSERRSISEIAKLLGVAPTTVLRWIKDYIRFGFAGLAVGKSSGRPRKVDIEADAALHAALGQNPRDLGYRFTRWTTETLAEHLYRAVHVRVHPETVRRALSRLRYRYKRPKLSLGHKQDPRALRRARARRDKALKKGHATPSATSFSSWTSASSTSTPA